MESHHFGLSIGDLHEEQVAIDAVIDSLLNFTPTPVPNRIDLQKRNGENPNNGIASSGTLNSPSAQVKKGRCRPPKVIVPPTSPLPSSNQKVSIESVAECIKRLNAQNKNLLRCIEVLHRKVEIIADVEGVTPSDGENPPKTILGDVSNRLEKLESNLNSNNQDCRGPAVENPPSALLDDVSNRLEKLENNLNSNNLVCRGPGVESLIDSSSIENAPPNLERLKGDLCRAICGDNATGVDICNLQLSVFGREKKMLKLHCQNTSSKLYLLKQARKNKPEGTYVSEQLTKAKSNIFYNLRQLRKQHPGKIKSAFTRGGNIYYKLQNSNLVVQVHSLSDLQNIVPASGSVVVGE